MLSHHEHPDHHAARLPVSKLLANQLFLKADWHQAQHQKKAMSVDEATGGEWRWVIG
ncbi:hypothetical protein RSAG8_13700, partial [Rhizoctonia solani AG-8 WAC10335]